jgi:hypothetical protein
VSRVRYELGFILTEGLRGVVMVSVLLGLVALRSAQLHSSLGLFAVFRYRINEPVAVTGTRGPRFGLFSHALVQSSRVRIALEAWIFTSTYSKSVFSCVYVQALRWTDPTSRESCRLCTVLRKPKRDKGASKCCWK